MKAIMSRDLTNSEVVARLLAVEKAVERNEKIQAQFTRAYSEVIAMLNAIGDELTKDYTEQERADFRRRVNVAKLEVVKLMQEAVSEVEQSQTKSPAATTAVGSEF